MNGIRRIFVIKRAKALFLSVVEQETAGEITIAAFGVAYTNVRKHADKHSSVKNMTDLLLI